MVKGKFGNVSKYYETDCSKNTFFIKGRSISYLSLNKLGEMSRTTIVLGNFHEAKASIDLFFLENSFH